MLHPDRMPGSERALVGAGKAGYLLRAAGRESFFRTILGFETEEALAAAVERLAGELARVPARFSRLNPAGRENWVALLEIAGPRRTARIFTVWERLADGRASFVTARPLQEGDALRFERWRPK